MMKVLVVLMLVCSVQSVSYKQGDIDDIKLELKNLQEKNKEQAAKLDKQEDQLKEQSMKQVAQQTEVGKLKKQLQGEQVAFAASLYTSGNRYFGPYSGDTPMVFKHVFTNIGDAYSPVTGRFTAPLRGAYHFECNIFGFGANRIGAFLMKNSEYIFYAAQNNKNSIDSASNSVTLLLNPGDVVNLRQLGGTQVYDSSSHHTTFSGHLLFSM